MKLPTKTKIPHMPGNGTPKVHKITTTGIAVARLESTLARRYESIAPLIESKILRTRSACTG